jgi:hypothetical protein
MQEFTAKYADRIQGVLSGFDRLVFRGSLRKIAYPFGMQGYLWANQVLLKEFGAHVNEVSARVKQAALECVGKPAGPCNTFNPARTTRRKSRGPLHAGMRLPRDRCAL